jgi:hypothetical protein
MAEYFRRTLDTKFHIDFDWWKQRNRSMRVHLASHLCPSCQSQYADEPPQDIDWIDPFTGEVKQVDILWDVIRDCCSQQNSFITPHTSLATAVFLTLVANDNAPLSPVELHESLTNKPASLILRTIGGRQAFFGIKPVTRPVVRRNAKAGR